MFSDKVKMGWYRY